MTMSSNINSEGNKDVSTIEKSYVCDICGFRCCKSSILKSHMLIHSEEKPFECSICHKCFKDRSYLKKHYRIHTGEKPYSCDICQRHFSQISHLKQHSRMHHNYGDKPHCCIFCEKTFMFMSALKVHLRIHTNEKPYVCDLCQKAFHLRQQFVDHRLTHLEGKQYSCSICTKKFRSRRGVQQHKKVQHESKLTTDRTIKRIKSTKVKPAISNLPPRKICPKPCLITATTIKLPLPLKTEEMIQTPLNMTPQQKMAQWRNILPTNQKPKSNQKVSKVSGTQKKRLTIAPKTPKGVIHSQKLSSIIAPKPPIAPFPTAPLCPMIMIVTCPLIQTQQVL